jgi:hypothetical protein
MWVLSTRYARSNPYTVYLVDLFVTPPEVKQGLLCEEDGPIVHFPPPAFYNFFSKPYLLWECFAPTDIFAFLEIHPLNVELLSAECLAVRHS